MQKASKSEVDYSRGHAGAHCGKVLEDRQRKMGRLPAPLQPQLRYGPPGTLAPRRQCQANSAELSASLLREFEPRIFQGAFRHQQQAVGFERFFDKVVGTASDGGSSRLDLAVTGD